jgi:SAM-dependent methyltransferase
MKQNKYDDPAFFHKYSQMKRSIVGLNGAGEWKTLEKMLPDFSDKRVLDLGCGFGWHCQYAIDHGAKSVMGVDISTKMIDVAKEKTSKEIEYFCKPIEDLEFPPESFDAVISSLTFHYLASFDDILNKVNSWLALGGDFVFSVEHPVYTSSGGRDFVRNENGDGIYFPVDDYYLEGKRETHFLGEDVRKYHRTLTTYLDGLLKAGFEITGVQESKPSEELIKEDESIKEELKRPLMLLVSAKKR